MLARRQSSQAREYGAVRLWIWENTEQRYDLISYSVLQHRSFGISTAVWQGQIFLIWEWLVLAGGPSWWASPSPRSALRPMVGASSLPFECLARGQGGAGGTHGWGPLGSGELGPAETTLRRWLRLLLQATPGIKRSPPRQWQTGPIWEDAEVLCLAAGEEPRGNVRI